MQGSKLNPVAPEFTPKAANHAAATPIRITPRPVLNWASPASSSDDLRPNSQPQLDAADDSDGESADTVIKVELPKFRYPLKLARRFDSKSESTENQTEDRQTSGDSGGGCEESNPVSQQDADATHEGEADPFKEIRRASAPASHLKAIPPMQKPSGSPVTIIEVASPSKTVPEAPVSNTPVVPRSTVSLSPLKENRPRAPTPSSVPAKQQPTQSRNNRGRSYRGRGRPRGRQNQAPRASSTQPQPQPNTPHV